MNPRARRIRLSDDLHDLAAWYRAPVKSWQAVNVLHPHRIGQPKPDFGPRTPLLADMPRQLLDLHRVLADAPPGMLRIARQLYLDPGPISLPKRADALSMDRRRAYNARRRLLDFLHAGLLRLP